MSLIVTLLSWWLVATEASDSCLLSALADVEWVLGQLALKPADDDNMVVD